MKGGDINAGDINRDLARACVWASAGAYEGETFGSGLAHGLVVERGGCRVVAFRGTAALHDWVTDVDVRWADVGVGRVHEGFWRAANSMFDQVLGLARRAEPTPMVLTGHSLGGALAVVVAWLLARRGLPVVSVFTFGGPRVGDARFAQSYDSTVLRRATAVEPGQAGGGAAVEGNQARLGLRTFRFVHEEDVVPRMPPWIMGWRHVGQEVFMSSFGGVEMNPPWWRKGASSLWGTFWGYRHGEVEQVTDHQVGKYRVHIEAL